MELTLSEILKTENNGKRFRHIEKGIIVKNVDGSLVFAKEIEYVSGEKNIKDNVIHVKETGKIRWEKATATNFWINGKYEEIEDVTNLDKKELSNDDLEKIFFPFGFILLAIGCIIFILARCYGIY